MSATSHSQATLLADALASAVLGWELHFRPEVLEAALWLGSRVEWAIRKKLQEPRTRIARPLSDQLFRASDPRLAGFIFRALAIPELRHAAARAIERAKDPSFIRALASETWLLADPEIERGCRWIRELRWLGSRSEEFLALDGQQAAGAARLLNATAMASARKTELFRELVAIRQSTADPLLDVRATFSQARPADRLKALRTVRDSGLTGEFAEQVYRLTRDPAAVVRSSAVAMLAGLPTATSGRILRAALDDPDLRVQANAIEALDVLGVEDRAAQIEPKLQSPDSRVRASAVKSLLPLEVRKAGDVLLDMLEDSSCAHRLGALWVIERLELRAAVQRVNELCLVDSVERVRHSARRVVRVLSGDSESQSDGAVPYGWSAQGEA